MKTKRSTRFLSALLAFVMVALLIPFGVLPTIADGWINLDADTMGSLGRGYNMLGGKALNSDNLSIQVIITDLDGAPARKLPGVSDIGYTYAYITDMEAYVMNEVTKASAKIGVDAKIKLVTASVESAATSEYSKTESFSANREYALITAYKKVADYRLSADAQDVAKWKISEDLKNEVLALTSAADVLAFFERWGTHIVVAYDAGASGTYTYSSESLKHIVDQEYSESMSVNTKVGLSGLGSIAVGYEQEYSNHLTSTNESTKVYKNFSGYGSGSTFTLNEETLPAYFASITEDTAMMMSDDGVELLPIWTVLRLNGCTAGEEFAKKVAWMELCFNQWVVADNTAFYAEMGKTYTPAEDEEIDTTAFEIITNAEEFNNIRNNLDGKYILACNIDLSGYENWEPIGTADAPFTGELHGNGNTIKNLNITSATDGVAGLFGYNAGIVRDLAVKGNVTLHELNEIPYVGGIAAYNREKGTIVGCSDKIVYDVDYESVLPLREIVLENNMQITVLAPEYGVKLVGEPGVTYTGVCVNIEESPSHPAYILLENAHFVGSSTAAIYATGTRPINIISVGKGNSISGATDVKGILAKNAPLNIFGDAPLTVKGGAGRNGTDGAHGADGHSGKGGNGGNGGAEGIWVKQMLVNGTMILSVLGGNGGNGGAGGYGNCDWNSNKGGADGAWGSSGGRAVVADKVTLQNVESLSLTGGTGGRGGGGGAWGYGVNHGWGGNGGNGGNGGSPIEVGTLEMFVPYSNLVINNGVGGQGGNAGHADNGTNYGSSGSSGSAVAQSIGRIVDALSGKTYSIYRNALSWTNAQQAAIANGEQLVSINSAEEQAIVEMLSGGTYCWIGLHRKDTAENLNWWVWEDGTEFFYTNSQTDCELCNNLCNIGHDANGKLVYTNWLSGEPNCGEGTENYGGTYPTAWNDYNNNSATPKGYVTEFDTETAAFVDVPAIPYVRTTYGVNEGTVENCNGAEWNETRLQIESVTKTEYYTGFSYNGTSILAPEAFVPGSVVLSYEGNILTPGATEADGVYALPFENAGTTDDPHLPYTGPDANGEVNEGVFTLAYKGSTRYIPFISLMSIPTSMEFKTVAKNEFIVNTDVSCDGLKVTLNFSTGVSGEIAYDANAVANLLSVATPSVNDVLGTASVAVACDLGRYGIFRTTYDVEYVDAVTTDFVVLMGTVKTTYKRGEIFTGEGLELYVKKNNGQRYEIAAVNNEKVEYFYNFSEAGEAEVTVVYDKIWKVKLPAKVTVKDELVDGAPVVSIVDRNAIAGGVVYVAVSLQNNPGIVGMTLNVTYDESVLELLGVEEVMQEVVDARGKIVKKPVLGHSAHNPTLESPYILWWNNGSAKENFMVEGSVALLKFKVSEDAPNGDYTVSVNYSDGAITNYDNEDVKFYTLSGTITVKDVELGDVNGDGKLSMADVTLLVRYTVDKDWKDVKQTILSDLAVCDINGDGRITSLDAVDLERHLAGWPDYATLPTTKK